MLLLAYLAITNSENESYPMNTNITGFRSFDLPFKNLRIF